VHTYEEHDGYSYGQSWANVYEDYYDNREDVEVVSAFLAKLAGTGRALEFGIGTGRVALPLADRGVEVYGIDNSKAMVRRLQEKPGGDKISVVVGDMASTRAEGTFSLVYVTFSSIFMLASQEEQVRCFANAARHLEEGGVVVVDSFVPDHSRWQRGQTSSITRLELGLGGWCLSRARVVAGESGFGENHIDVILDSGVADDSRDDPQAGRLVAWHGSGV
jgi:SAM-dependent methyltransferase